MSNSILQIRDLKCSFGALRAVDGVSFSVNKGTITGLIGPNGAGKTTLFGLIAGALSPDSGEIKYNGGRIDGLTPDRIFRTGLARTFQIPRPFPQMTVLENVMLTHCIRPVSAFGTTGSRFGAVQRRRSETANALWRFWVSPALQQGERI